MESRIPKSHVRPHVLIFAKMLGIFGSEVLVNCLRKEESFGRSGPLATILTRCHLSVAKTPTSGALAQSKLLMQS